MWPLHTWCVEVLPHVGCRLHPDLADGDREVGVGEAKGVKGVFIGGEPKHAANVAHSRPPAISCRGREKDEESETASSFVTQKNYTQAEAEAVPTVTSSKALPSPTGEHHQHIRHPQRSKYKVLNTPTEIE